MTESFSSLLQQLRTGAKLTNHELARLADTPESLISGLQTNYRRVGEYQARKIAKALNLTGDSLEDFIYHAIDMSTAKILVEAKPYPARLLNLLAIQLNRSGIPAALICDLTVSGNPQDQDVTLVLDNGSRAILKTHLQIP